MPAKAPPRIKISARQIEIDDGPEPADSWWAPAPPGYVPPRKIKLIWIGEARYEGEVIAAVTVDSGWRYQTREDVVAHLERHASYHFLDGDSAPAEWWAAMRDY